MSIHEETSVAAANKRMKKVHCVDHVNLMLKELMSHYESHQMSDIVLIAGNDGKRVSAHRLVLSASSPYFKAMFTGSLREATEKEVTLKEVQGDILQTLVEFCYSGHIELRQDTVEKLLITASLLQINSVVAECSSYLEEQLDPSNCLGMLSLADRHNCKELHKKARDYVHKEFMEICKNDEFFKLSATQLAELIASDDLNVSNEEDVYYSIIKWVNSHLSTRKQHIRELLPLVRVTQLPLSFVQKRLQAVFRSNDCLDMFVNASDDLNVSDEEDVFNSVMKWANFDLSKIKQHAPELLPLVRATQLPRSFVGGNLMALGRSIDCLDMFVNALKCMFVNALKWHKEPDERHKVATKYTKPRNGTLLAIGSGMDMSKLRIEWYCPRSDKWTFWNNVNDSRSDFSVAIMGDNLLIVGGKTRIAPALSSVINMNMTTLAVTELKPMNTPRSYLDVAVVGNNLYAIGGFDGRKYVNTVERWDPVKGDWNYVASMTTTRDIAGTAVLNGCIYVVGGCADVSTLRTVECYNPGSNTWTARAPMSVARSSFGIAVSKGLLYVVGGDTPDGLTSAAECYDPVADKWTMIEYMKRRRSGLVCAVIGKCLMVIDGKMRELFDEYDLEKKKWNGKPAEGFDFSAIGIVPKWNITKL